MKNVNFVLIPSTSITPTFNSTHIDTSQVLYMSLQVLTAAGASPVYAVKLQASNDPCPNGILPAQFTPTNWADITGATVSITANGVVVIPKQELSYRWVRAVVTYTSGSGNVTASVFGVCV